MKHTLTTIPALVCAAFLTLPVQAATTSGSAVAQVSSWLGTWSCTSPGNNHTAAFSSLFGGKAMRISETGSTPSEELIVFNTKKQEWIDEYLDASNSYSTMIGTPSGDIIRFTTAYPKPGPILTVIRSSKNAYSSVFTATMNGKKIVVRESCTKT